MMHPIKQPTIYLLLILSVNLGLMIPPLRFPAALMLLCFLPGYFLSLRLTLWRNPLFAAIGSIGLSFLLSPLIALPGSILLGEPKPFVVVISLDIFLMTFLYSLRGEAPIRFPEKNHSPFLAPLLILICSFVFIYMDITKLGPFCEDWAYLFGIIKELSRNIPPQDPEASFLLLKYPWGFYFFYALLHRLGGIPAWNVLEFIPVLICFCYLGLIYMIIFQVTRNKTSGLWAIIFMAVGNQSEWVLRGFMGYGWNPGFSFNLHWEEAQALTGYSLLWGWYLLPSLLPPLTAFFFLIRYQQEKQKKDLWLSLGACAVSPFFHPVFYLGFLGGFSLYLAFQWLRKNLDPRLLLYFATFIPYYLTFYLFFKPGNPDIPVYQFMLDKLSLTNALWDYLRVNGIALPFALLAVFRSPEARTWFLPFAFPFALLCILGQGAINHTAHVMFQNRLYLSLLTAVGLGSLRKIPRTLRASIYLLVLIIIILPFIFQVSHRAKTGWEGVLDVEQKAAGEFIRLYTEENSSFLILPDSRYSIVCVEGIGERKLVWGWFYHLNRYVPVNTLQEIREKIKQFYSTVDPEFRNIFINYYRPNYIFLGPDEITRLMELKIDMERFIKGFRLVYKSTHILILEIESDYSPKSSYPDFPLFP